MTCLVFRYGISYFLGCAFHMPHSIISILQCEMNDMIIISFFLNWLCSCIKVLKLIAFVCKSDLKLLYNLYISLPLKFVIASSEVKVFNNF